LLLSDELALLEELVSKVEHLEFETLDEEAIKSKLLPLFDDLLLTRLAQKESDTVNILSRYLAQIITQSAAHDPAALEHSLQSIISPAIAQEIAENKDKMIDALYPIMGGMISKYVTQAIKEMMEKINEKIEQGLSIERYKRKFKAKLTGVSETELLLEESSDADIQSIFVIQKETGLLIAEAHLANSEIDDPHMVASMASAIKDFVNDWITSQEETDSKEVQLLSYGDATLYIESAGSVYLVAFLDAEPDYEQRSKINAFFGKLLKKQSQFFQSFDGDDSAPQIKQIEEMIQQFLSEENRDGTGGPESKKKNSAKYIFLALGLLLIALAGYWAKEKYDLYLLEKRLSQRTGTEIKIKEENDKLYIKGHLASVEDLYRVEDFLKKYTKKKIINEIYLSPAEFDEKLKKQHHTLQKLSQKEKETDKKEAVFISEIALLKSELQKMQRSIEATEKKLQTITENMQRTKAKLSHVKRTVHIKDEMLNKLKDAFEENPDFQTDDGSLDFRNKRLFEAGGTTPTEDALKKMDDDLEKYIEILMGDERLRPYVEKFIIEGYTDTSGSHELNKKLSFERAKVIKDHLLTLPVANRYGLKNRIEAKGMAESSPIYINGVEDKDASRRIKIRFILDRDKIVDNIEQNI